MTKENLTGGDVYIYLHEGVFHAGEGRALPLKRWLEANKGPVGAVAADALRAFNRRSLLPDFVEATLAEYGAGVSPLGFIQKGPKVLSVRPTIRGDTLVMETADGRKLHSGPIEPAAVRDFVESFWHWERPKPPKRTPKSLAELRAEAPSEIGDYGALAWAISRYIEDRGGPSIDWHRWSGVWHNSVVQFANKPDATIEQIVRSVTWQADGSARDAARVAQQPQSETNYMIRQLRQEVESPPYLKAHDVAKAIEVDRKKAGVRLGTAAHEAWLRERSPQEIRHALATWLAGPTDAWLTRISRLVGQAEQRLATMEQRTNGFAEMKRDYIALVRAAGAEKGDVVAKIAEAEQAVDVALAAEREQIKGRPEDAVLQFLSGGWKAPGLSETERKDLEALVGAATGAAPSEKTARPKLPPQEEKDTQAELREARAMVKRIEVALAGGGAAARAEDRPEYEARLKALKARMAELQHAIRTGEPAPKHGSGYVGYVYVADAGKSGRSHKMTVWPARSREEAHSLYLKYGSDLRSDAPPYAGLRIGGAIALAPNRGLAEEVAVTIAELAKHRWKIDPAKVTYVYPESG